LIRDAAGIPGSILGSSRQALETKDYGLLFEVLAQRDIRYLFYNGGNGSMQTALEIHREASLRGYDLRVIGIPKTIDNDLEQTDHTPGYGSTARFFALAARDVGADNGSLPGTITVLEVMGRNVGWLAAATSLARWTEEDSPHLIYFPERPLEEDVLLGHIENVYRRLGRCVIAVCEGQLNDKGIPLGGADPGPPDAFGRKLSGNVGYSFAKMVGEVLGVRARSEKPGVLGRSTASVVSETDRHEAWLVGVSAVRAAIQGESGVMVTLAREPGSEYRIATGLTPLETVAHRERRFPAEWISSDGNDVAPGFREWALPLTGEIELRPHLREV
jgi:6-phosphofructokinase 1